MQLQIPDNKKTYDLALMLICLFVFILYSISVSYAAQDVVYKDSRPLKKIFDEEDNIVEGEKGKDYLYDPSGKTDPFKSFIVIIEETKKEKEKKPKTYLETLELSQLDLIVIVVGKEGKWAMVKDSKGVGHVIKEGTPIGTNGGVVQSISEGQVTIREEFRDFRGRTQFKDVVKKTPSLR